MFQTPTGLHVFQLSFVEVQKKRAFCPLVAEQKGALETNETKLIFVEDHAIHHHSVARPGIVVVQGGFLLKRAFAQRTVLA